MIRIFSPLWEVGTELWSCLYCVIAESTMYHSQRTLLRADFAGPFTGAQFLGISISEDVCALKFSVGTIVFRVNCFNP
jgi:hypothetical protein